MNPRFSLSKLAAPLLMASSLAMSMPALASGTLNVATSQDPGSWDPIDTYLLAWSTVATNIFDGLTYRDTDLTLKPALATQWQELDNGRRIRFTLRQGVTFQNGEPFNTEAVKYTFDRLLGEEGRKGPQRSNYSAIEKVTIVDNDTVDFYLSQPDPVLLTKLSGYGAMIVPPKYIEEKGEAYFNRHPIGTGAFELTQYDPKVGVTLKAFANHWRGAPKLDRLHYRFIAEPATAVAELQSGRVDMVVPPIIPISMVPTIEKDAKLSIESATSPSVYALRFNTKNGITEDVRVRKAIIYGVDRQTIIDAILGGQAQAITSFQSSISFGNDPELKPLPYDPAKAKALLKQAGVKPGTSIQIDIRGNNATFNEVAQAIASYLQIIGLNATIKPYESNIMLNDIIPNGKTGAMFQQGWGGWTLDYDNTAYFMYHSGEKWNPYDSDAKLDRLLEQQRSMTDKTEREALLKTIARYTVDQALELPLYSLNAIYGVSNKVKNFTPAVDNRLLFNQVTVE
ncbi:MULTISPECIES: ABC transporter substrate-binding protein [unclassified Vibrio]|uniref:ABC transporter substrate-binding protein n=1 Tax=Vibrio sp. HB236076 TaxID=3232307 RepID=A0AB39HFJ8_9VIBR|nr:ABC transporter substrate-binding protein [Vibrio sp. HB161653]MDP5255373.1 ABC transporter substrate-binding protein [Vibrio sp. HB161653]